MLVSVLIPCHDCERFIARCVKSIEAQTHGELQIIAVDDGSTDDTVAVLRSLSSNDGRLEVVSQDYKGVGDARNTALDHAKGEAFMFVDADDWIEPDTIEAMLRHMEEDDLDFCACSMVRDSDGYHNPLLATRRDYEVCNHGQAVWNYLTHKSLQGSVCNKLIRRSVAEGLRFRSGWAYAEDTMFVWELLQRVKRCGHMSKMLYHYSVTPNSLTESLYDDSHLTYIEMWEKVCEDVSANYPQWSEEALGKMGNAIVSVLYDIARTKADRPQIVKSLCGKLRHLYKSMTNKDAFNLRYLLFGLVAPLSWPTAEFAAKAWHKIRN